MSHVSVGRNICMCWLRGDECVLSVYQSDAAACSKRGLPPVLVGFLFNEWMLTYTERDLLLLVLYLIHIANNYVVTLLLTTCNMILIRIPTTSEWILSRLNGNVTRIQNKEDHHLSYWYWCLARPVCGFKAKKGRTQKQTQKGANNLSSPSLKNTRGVFGSIPFSKVDKDVEVTVPYRSWSCLTFLTYFKDEGLKSLRGC